MVTIVCNGVIPTVQSSTETVIATLSETYRPSMTQWLTGRSSGASQNTVLISVGVNGDIMVYNYTGGGISYLYASGSYAK